MYDIIYLSHIGNADISEALAFEAKWADYVLEKPMKMHEMDRLLEYIQLHGVKSGGLWLDINDDNYIGEQYSETNRVKEFFMS